MTYVNTDLQSLPPVIDLRVGTDPQERTLQLAYWQVFASLQGINDIKVNPQYPETIVNAGKESEFDTAIDNLLAELTSATGYFNEIWDMVPA